MPDVDVTDFESSIQVRQSRIEDYPVLHAMQLACFPGIESWTQEHLESQLAHFPEGQLCVEYEGQIVASSSSLIVDSTLYSEWHNWKAVSDNGFIRNHNPRGDTLYGLEMMVHPDFRGLKLSRRLYEARKRLCRERGLARIIIGGRVPGYHHHSKDMSVQEYVQKVMEKKYFDPVLTAQVSNGFVLKGLIPNYLPSDTDSCGYATFLEWTNLDHVPGRPLRPANPVEPVRLCVVQYMMRRIHSFEEFAQQCEYFVDVASDYKSDFCLFPEMFTIQLLSCTEPSRPGLAARRLAEYTPQYLELFNSLAVKYNVNIIGGSHFTVEDDTLYNIAYLFHRNGKIDRQHKIHVTPTERRWWGVQPGHGLKVFETDRGRIAVLVCYDIEFPELIRILASKGAQIIFCPFNTDTQEGYLRVRYCAQARAVENHVYVAIAGCTGNLPFVENADIHYAQSGIFTPADIHFTRGGIAAECNANIETVIIHDVDVELVRRHRHIGTVQNWNDRRRDLYRVVYNDEGVQREI